MTRVLALCVANRIEFPSTVSQLHSGSTCIVYWYTANVVEKLIQPICIEIVTVKFINKVRQTEKYYTRILGTLEVFANMKILQKQANLRYLKNRTPGGNYGNYTIHCT